MSDPLSDVCLYCGSPEVLDDAWDCGSAQCTEAYHQEMKERHEYEQRTPLTRNKAIDDLWKTRACVWGHMVAQIEDANARLVATIFPTGHVW